MRQISNASLIFITAVKKNLDSRNCENSKLVVGYGEQDYNYAFLIFITAVTKNNKINFKNCENSKLVVGSSEQDYNHASLIFIAAVPQQLDLIL